MAWNIGILACSAPTILSYWNLPISSYSIPANVNLNSIPSVSGIFATARTTGSNTYCDYSFDGVTWNSIDTTAITYLYGTTTYNLSTSPEVKDSQINDYFSTGPLSYNTNTGYQTNRIIRWAKTGSMLSVADKNWYGSPNTFFSGISAMRFGSRAAFFVKSANIGASSLNVDIITSNSAGGAVQSLSTSIAYNGNYGFSGLYLMSSRKPWIILGKTWTGNGSDYLCHYIDASSMSAGTVQMTLNDSSNMGYMAVLENGYMAISAAPNAGSTYYAFLKTAGNPWGQIPSSRNATWPAGVNSSSVIHINEAGTKAKIFISGLGVWESTNLQTWTLVSSNDVYNDPANGLAIIENPANSAQELGLWKTLSTDTTYKLGVRTK